MSAFDGLVSSIDAMNRAKGERAFTSEMVRIMDEKDKTLQKWIEANSANYTEKHALRAALAKLEPNHPLLKNKALQERIQELGRKIQAMEGTSEDLAKAGLNFKY